MAPVLYASQWFLTLFSCPFPAAFSCRIIDTVLAEGHSEILQQACCRRCSSCASSCSGFAHGQGFPPRFHGVLYPA